MSTPVTPPPPSTLLIPVRHHPQHQPPHSLPPLIPPRSFNTITLQGSHLTKTSSSPSILGELHFYLNIPPHLSHLFPKLHDHIPPKPPINRTTLSLQYIPSPTLSHRLTTLTLTPTHLHILLTNLHTLHTPIPATPHLYKNYVPKLMSRYSQNLALYTATNLSTRHISSLSSHLQAYQSAARAQAVAIIHGDPVLTNVLAPADRLVFIDMRGLQGSHLTLHGDATYDLAKVFQSLCGYDFILCNRRFSDTCIPYLRFLHSVFRDQVARLYPRLSFLDLVLVTCSLFTSLIPLHEDAVHRAQFAAVAKALLHVFTAAVIKNVHLDIMNVITNHLKEVYTI